MGAAAYPAPIITPLQDRRRVDAATGEAAAETILASDRPAFAAPARG